MRSDIVNSTNLTTNEKVLLRTIIEYCNFKYDEFNDDGLPFDAKYDVDLSDCFVNSKLKFDQGYLALKKLFDLDLIYVHETGSYFYLRNTMKYILYADSERTEEYVLSILNRIRI